MRISRGTLLSTMTLAILAFGYVVAVSMLAERPRARIDEGELEVYMPPPLQLVSAVGDRYLAANVAVFRCFMVGAEQRMRPESYALLARLHVDAALFNPGHEDNYYIAAAILPWEGHVRETQYVLARAMEARTQDYLPAFLYAFNQRKFEHDARGGAKTLLAAASRLADSGVRTSLEALAARWFESADGTAAVDVLLSLAKSTRNPQFSAFLLKRVQRLENVGVIEQALERWKARRSDVPPSLDELVYQGDLQSTPEDPFGANYTIGKDGQVVITERKGR